MSEDVKNIADKSERVLAILDGLEAIAQKATRSDEEWVNLTLGRPSEKFKEDREVNALYLRRFTPLTALRLITSFKKAIAQRDETIQAYAFSNGQNDIEAEKLIDKDSEEILAFLEKQDHSDKH